MVASTYFSNWKKAGLRTIVGIYVCMMLSVTVLVFNLVATTYSFGFSFIDPCTTSGDTDITDFLPLYGIGRLNYERISGHRELNVYSPALMTQEVQRAVAPWRPAEIYAIQYPPTLFFLVTPLALVPLKQAFEIWLIATILATSAAYWVLVWNRIKGWLGRLSGFLLCFTSLASWYLLYGGQTSGFELFAVAISLSLLQRSQPFLSGVAAGFTLLKVQHSPMAILPGVCVGRLKFLLGFALSVFIQAVLAAFVVGPANTLNFVYINYVCEVSHQYYAHNEPWSMHNLRSIMCCLCPHVPVTQIAVAAYLLVLLAIVVLWLCLYPRLKAKRFSGFYLLASLTTILLLVFGVHAYDYDYVFMMIPCVFLYAYACQDECHSSALLRNLLKVSAVLYPLSEISVSPMLEQLFPSFAVAFRGQLTDLICVIPLFSLAVAALVLEYKFAQAVRDDA